MIYPFSISASLVTEDVHTARVIDGCEGLTRECTKHLAEFMGSSQCAFYWSLRHIYLYLCVMKPSCDVLTELGVSLCGRS